MSAVVPGRIRVRPAPRLPAEQRVRLHAAVKSDDSPFTTFVISPWSKHVAWWSAQRGIGPNTVTAASLGIAVAAAGCCVSGTRAGYVAGALLLQGSFALDCADGQLARLTATFSPLGAWLDATFDRVKEYLVYAGLAAGASRSGDDVWALAGAALVLQTTRHLVDFSWSVTPASQAAIAAGARARAAGHRRRWHYARKVAILPIGERWALISLLTALGSPRTTLTVLLGANGLASAYMLAARLRPRDAQRAASAGPTGMEQAATGALEAFRDAGPLARV
ncbi:MAG: CDP-alcohol phosphatidyltransferase family protein, partial [Actinomycetota bacterium]|nr:CDP-alcohol phosphatidyltransferase family protein [Actinomycetota bacterium]